MRLATASLRETTVVKYFRAATLWYEKYYAKSFLKVGELIRF